MPASDTDLLAESFKTLAHPRRARIFKLLSDRPELGRNLKSLKLATRFSDGVLDHHLRIMERGNLLQRRQAGGETHLSLHTVALRRAIASAAIIARRNNPTLWPTQRWAIAANPARVTLPPPAAPPIKRATGIEAQ